MDFAFAQINSVMNSLVSNQGAGTDMVSGLAAGSIPADSDFQTFADQLSGQLEKFSDAGQGMLGESDTASLKKVLLDQIQKGEHIGFLSALKSRLQGVSEGDLGALTIDDQGLDALKNLLLLAGFDAARVEELISDLKSAENPTLDGLMDQLFQLPMADDTLLSEANENFLETSAIPFLESMLTSLGIDHGEVEEILSQASWGRAASAWAA